MAKVKVRVHLDDSTADLDMEYAPKVIISRIEEMGTRGVWRTDKLWYPPSRIVKVEVL